ncbi:MAG: nuclear transport factor 2 family protein [Gammaproteobacteria bacterium]
MSMPPDATQEQRNAHYRAVLHAYVDALARENADDICALYADDAVIEDPVGAPPRTGKATIREFYEMVVRNHVRLKIVGPVVGSHGNAAAMPVRVFVKGAELDCISVAHFDGQGRIARYMAHWGPGDYDAAGGEPSARLS